MRHKYSSYLRWAKESSPARFNLASSGVASFPLDRLPLDGVVLEINGDNSYGYAPLQKAIAQHCAVDPACVVETAGTAMANHLAMATLLEPGDEVLMEEPIYGPLLDCAHYLEADVKRFRRLEENGWAVDPEEIARSLSRRTKLIVLTNLHNPTSVLTPNTVLREVGELAASVGARVLVDEVYLDSVDDPAPGSCFHLGSQFVATNSLTKNYGVSGLRCGWILAEPELAWEMRRLNDLFGVTPVHPGELLSLAAFKNLDSLREKARTTVEADRKLLAQFLVEQNDLLAAPAEWGMTLFPHLRSGDTEAFVIRLRAEFETSVVPGRFFESPNHFRLGFGVNHEMFAEGLRRIGRALESRPTR